MDGAWRRPIASAPMDSAPSPLLLARGLTYHRNQDRIFGPLDVEVAAGDAVLVRGGNGAGKTTLLRVLAGLLEATGGQATLLGRAVDTDHLAREVAYLGHRPGHKADLSALSNLRHAAALHGADGALARLEDALEAVGLAGYEDTPAGRMSAGQNKRLALARLSLHPGRLWLMDEPYANLDLEGIALVDRMVGEHTARGGGALITTHGAYAAPPGRVRTLALDGAAP
ncbi:MAG: heme ABC exporter ATP-binding protein CcmA [Lysobacteraceae bacterium]|nr:heme ABC exporter ATP-binding protein CcmA [Xanthomonadaceae bacterium]MCZ8317575.1 heme ABC exporter ATP-binding protein CcmA [Silanimonas sp.]